MDETTSLATLKQDPRNARKHNPRNIGMIEDSLKKVGAARSIVIDENNVILAGNGTVEAAGNAGMENVRIIEASGNEIVAVRRTGLTEEQKTILKMSDNRANELSDWDGDMIRQMEQDHKGIIDSMFASWELEKITDSFDPEEINPPNLSSSDRPPIQQMTFTLHDDQVEQVKFAMEKAKAMGDFVDTGNENGNGNAIARVCEVFLGVG